MLNLDPAKLLVIAVVAIILLGPDKLPQVARQVGGAWRSFNEFRHRMETEVRSSMPDLPSTTEIARLARSPSALLDHLSNMGTDDEATEPESDSESESESDVAGGEIAAASDQATEPAVDSPPSLNGNGNGNGNGPVALTNGSDHHDATPLAETTPAVPAPPPVPAPNPRSSDVVVPGDPSLN
jgi:sec-independent protein translocase protein TatB